MVKENMHKLLNLLTALKRVFLDSRATAGILQITLGSDQARWL